MGARKLNLTAEEIVRPFTSELAEHFPPILSPGQLAKLLGKSVKTIYEWLAKGRLDGAFRKRGKHILLWRDRVLENIFNGREWD